MIVSSVFVFYLLYLFVLNWSIPLFINFLTLLRKYKIKYSTFKKWMSFQVYSSKENNTANGQFEK